MTEAEVLEFLATERFSQEFIFSYYTGHLEWKLGQAGLKP
jgi:hypothetical protein